MTIIVFSKDRALQLEAFLRSYRDQVTHRELVYVLYRVTSSSHAAAYASVFALYPFAVPCAERDFKTDLLALLPTHGDVLFCVDDQMFIRPWSGEPIAGLSLRLAPHLTRNYTTADAPQPVPPLTPCGELLTWSWAEGELSWGYPLALDGHVYALEEIRPLIQGSTFRSPNTLEHALQTYRGAFLHRRGYCYREAKMVNVPWNRVQTDWENACGIWGAETLRNFWDAGQRIDLRDIYGVINQSVHQEFPLCLERRP